MFYVKINSVQKSVIQKEQLSCVMQAEWPLESETSYLTSLNLRMHNEEVQTPSTIQGDM